eukprot:CAMPEP_0184666804 /NCGR_PEP_ID=MMETSP0308-20130426/63888_1 /TAXON_ID=38269 /ORGANISM="Gloeochaete witrockiana, Strain SAG 46.84" /LENGTH=50 /DNA_ID=CAMNT_0027111599 /DNA_START=66 /DNA_END=218 /DNA_ORIENTATION=+
MSNNSNLSLFAAAAADWLKEDDADDVTRALTETETGLRGSEGGSGAVGER